MSLLTMIATSLLAAAPAPATDDPATMIAAERQAMRQLAWMDGRWRGEAVTQTPNGEHRVTQTERIGPLLDGSIKVLEGRAFRADGSTGFNAFGVVSFDPASKRYTLHSYAQGRAGDFALTPTTDGYVWEIPAGPMIIRYTARLSGGVWTETGERIAPGQAPVQFFIMKLKRVGASLWPGANPMTRR